MNDLTLVEREMKSRYEMRHAILNVLVATTLGFGAQSLLAASDVAESIIRGAARAGDVELPATAMKGTGLAGQFNPAALASRGVSLTLPDGRVITAKRQRSVEDKAKGLKTWVGTFDSQPGSLLVMTTFRGSTTGFLTYGAETWELVPGKAGAHLLYRVDESKFPRTEPMLYGEATSRTSPQPVTTEPAVPARTRSPVATLMPCWSSTRRLPRRVGARRRSGACVENAVQAANQAYQNSQIGIALSLVGLREIQYAETGDISTSAYDLKGTSDGKMDGVHAIRDSVGADMVALISEDSNACGVAFTMRTESTSHASSAFGVVNSGCLSQHSLAHELGHIQGNQHDRASSSNVGVFP